ncbi:MAG TPA: hypothetical protein PK079_09160 [Leptospiraceae bacterium]|nr:hypothetical protein [Leptospiraceae bacterium]HMW06847.1 hypothetical protein [Leptospiraceae bacterium]HMX32251.1 hypothetical protein [Leptospiraceae bacterium]HMY32366.1 hypothetical protein [Leptospiraceae bacterium]HMZ66990.1 hypothetical protein [Leptospiraceae bacterium]
MKNILVYIILIYLITLNLYSENSILYEKFFLDKLFVYEATLKGKKRIIEKEYKGMNGPSFRVSEEEKKLSLQVNLNNDYFVSSFIQLHCKENACDFISMGKSSLDSELPANQKKNLEKLRDKSLLKVQMVNKKEIVILYTIWPDLKKDFILKEYDNSKESYFD